MLFVFSEQLSLNHQAIDRLWPVYLDENESLEFKELTLVEIANYQSLGHEICLVLSSKFVSFHQILLPKLAKKDMLAAIGSMLEDQLTEEFSKLHCFYKLEPNKEPFTYTIGLIDDLQFQGCLNFWSSHGVFLNQVTLDWYALANHQWLTMTDGDALANTDILGWVPRSLVNSKLLSSPKTSHEALSFESDIQKNSWIVQQLKQKSIFDIRMNTGSGQRLVLSRSYIEKGFKWGLAGWVGISMLLFMIFFGHNWWQYTKNQKWIESFSEQPTESLELKLAKYRHYQSEKNKFWTVFVALQHASNPEISIKSFDYNQEHLKLTVMARDMAHFQEFKRLLLQSRLKMDVSQVVVQQEGIKAIVDLKVSR